MVLAALSSGDTFRRFAKVELVAPPLLWPEVRSALHVARVRGLISPELATQCMGGLEAAPIAERRHRSLGRTAWSIADRFGWSKTYDAEYLALTQLLGATIATFDRRVRRAADQLGLSADF